MCLYRLGSSAFTQKKNETNMVDQYTHVTESNRRFHPTRPHKIQECTYAIIFIQIKNIKHRPWVRATIQTQSQTKKLQRSTVLDNDTINENHVTHKATVDKTKTMKNNYAEQYSIASNDILADGRFKSSKK
jgi:hypothetical protein